MSVSTEEMRRRLREDEDRPRPPQQRPANRMQGVFSPPPAPLRGQQDARLRNQPLPPAVSQRFSGFGDASAEERGQMIGGLARDAVSGLARGAQSVHRTATQPARSVGQGALGFARGLGLLPPPAPAAQAEEAQRADTELAPVPGLERRMLTPPDRRPTSEGGDDVAQSGQAGGLAAAPPPPEPAPQPEEPDDMVEVLRGTQVSREQPLLEGPRETRGMRVPLGMSRQDAQRLQGLRNFGLNEERAAEMMVMQDQAEASLIQAGTDRERARQTAYFPVTLGDTQALVHLRPDGGLDVAELGERTIPIDERRAAVRLTERSVTGETTERAAIMDLETGREIGVPNADSVPVEYQPVLAEALRQALAEGLPEDEAVRRAFDDVIEAISQGLLGR